MDEIEEALRGLDVSTPTGRQRALLIYDLLIKLGSVPIDGNPVGLGGLPLNAAALVEAHGNGDLRGVARALMGLGQDTALIVELIAHYAPRMLGGANAAAGTSAAAGTASTFLGGVLVMEEICHHFAVRLPGELRQQGERVFYVTSVTGLLSAWVFANPRLCRYDYLMELARRSERGHAGRAHHIWGSGNRTYAVERGRQVVQKLWDARYRDDWGKVLATRMKYANSARRMWTVEARLLDRRLGLRDDGQHASGLTLSRNIMRNHPIALGLPGGHGRLLPPRVRTP